MIKDNERAKNLEQNPVCTSNSNHIDVPTTLTGKLILGGVCYCACRVGLSACRRIDKDARLHGVLLSPGLKIDIS